MDAPITVAVITASAGVLASALTYFFTKRQEREAEWRRQKLESYKELVSALSGVLGTSPPLEAKVRFAHIANHILLVASPAVLVTLRRYLDETGDSKRDKTIDRHDELLTELFYAIRKHLGIRPNRASPDYLFKLWSAGGMGHGNSVERTRA